MDGTSTPSKAEQHRLHANARRSQLAAEVLPAGQVAATPARHVVSVMSQALPLELINKGMIRYDAKDHPQLAWYSPVLLAPNPQRGRIIDRGLDELARSLDETGQQEPIVARLITPSDRARWPQAFDEERRLIILKGHRIYHAQPKTRLTMLRVELMLPDEGEDDLAYARRCLRRASIKVMHSQAYDIFDKVNQYMVWRDEFALQKPKDADIAGYFEISRSEAQRLKIVAQLDNTIAQEIINADRRPADEVIFHIANHAPEEQADAYNRFGKKTVAVVRRMLEQDQDKSASHVTGAGRPRNLVIGVRDEESDIAYIGTTLTPQQWKHQGGAKAFLRSLRALCDDPAFHKRVQEGIE